MKEVSSKKYSKLQVSGDFKSWVKDMKDYFWHVQSVKEFIEYEEIEKCCGTRMLDVDVDSAQQQG